MYRDTAKLQAYSTDLWPAVLQDIQQLQYLEVNKQHITDAFLQAVGRLPKLNKLVVGCTGRDMGDVSESGAKAVAHVASIE